MTLLTVSRSATAFNNSREYWQPQINDPLLAEYNKITLDAIGFARSKTYPLPWSFDLAAYSILALLDHLDTPCVLVGDSMGGGPTGLRCALLDAGRIAAGNTSRILGVVACGTSAEEESSGTCLSLSQSIKRLYAETELYQTRFRRRVYHRRARIQSPMSSRRHRQGYFDSRLQHGAIRVRREIRARRMGRGSDST